MILRDSKIYTKVRDLIIGQELLKGADRVITGFSGGADSVCLLFILDDLRKDESFPDFHLTAMHIHHGIRKDEADRDAAFAKEFCKRSGIEYIEKRIDIPAVVRKTGESEEMAGRRLRYELFRKEAGPGTLIATAHHKNDSAETILMNIARGTGLSGLSGIKHKAGDIIRPLRCLTRKEIEDFVHSNGLEYVTDSTNSENTYTRNYVRNGIIPLFEKRVNSAFVEHLESLSSVAMRADAYFKSKAGEMFEECITEGGGVFVPDGLIGKYKSENDRILREYLYMLCFVNVSGDPKDLTGERIAAVEAIETTGSIIQLPRGVSAVRRHDGLVFLPNEALGSDKTPAQYSSIQMLDEENCRSLEAGKCVEIEGFGVHISMYIVKNYRKNNNSDYTKYFNYDRIKGSVCLRTRMAGDFITVTKDGGRRKLKSEMIDRHIPSEKRGLIPVIARGSECLWAVGIRQGMSAWAKEGDTRILCIEAEMKHDI